MLAMVLICIIRRVRQAMLERCAIVFHDQLLQSRSRCSEHVSFPNVTICRQYPRLLPAFFIESYNIRRIRARSPLQVVQAPVPFHKLM